MHYLCNMFVKRITLERALALGCLLMGMGIYLLFRSRGHLGFIVFDCMGMGAAVDAVRKLVDGVYVSEFVRFCLPDGLWTLSYIFFSDSVNRHESMIKRLAWVSVVPLLGVLSELMQLTQLVPGVFDVADLACYSVPLFVWMVMVRLEERVRKDSNN